MTNVVTCLPTLGGSVVDHVLVNEFDESIVNTFSTGPMTGHLTRTTSPILANCNKRNTHIDQCIRVQKEKRYIM